MNFDFENGFNSEEAEDTLVGSSRSSYPYIQWFNGKNDTYDPALNKQLPQVFNARGPYYPLENNEKLREIAEHLDSEEYKALREKGIKQPSLEQREYMIIRIAHDGGKNQPPTFKEYLYIKDDVWFFLSHGCPYPTEIPVDPTKQVGLAAGIWTKFNEKTRLQTTENFLECLAVSRKLTQAGFHDGEGMPIPFQVRFTGHASKEFYNALKRHYDFISWLRKNEIAKKAQFWQWGMRIVPSDFEVKHGEGRAYAVMSGHPEEFTKEHAKEMYVGELANQIGPFLYNLQPGLGGKVIPDSRTSIVVKWSQERIASALKNQDEFWHGKKAVFGTNKDAPIEWLMERQSASSGGFGRPKVAPAQQDADFDDFGLDEDDGVEEGISEEISTTEEIDPTIAGHLKALENGKAYYEARKLVTNANKVNAVLERWAENNLTPETLAAHAAAVTKDLTKRKTEATAKATAK